MFGLGEKTARIPGAAVLLAKRVALFPEEDLPIPFGPDLAVEVVSVSESARDAEKKLGSTWPPAWKKFGKSIQTNG